MHPTIANGLNGPAVADVIASVKSFIECVCLTILGEFGKTPPPDPNTSLLLGEAWRRSNCVFLSLCSRLLDSASQDAVRVEGFK
jgi:hypothetical protein